MSVRLWFLLFLSALLYGLPFFCGESLWWLIFIFSAPLLYVVSIDNVSFKQGFVWGMLVFGIHLSGFVCVVPSMAGNAWFIGFLLVTTLIVYQAICVGLFFLLAHAMLSRFAIQTYSGKLFVWSFVLSVLIMWIDRYSLWIFDLKEGYPLMHPLIPLVHCPALLQLLPLLGKLLLTYLLLLVSVAIVLFLLNKTIVSGLFLIGILFFWVICWLMPVNNVDMPHWFSYIKTLNYVTRVKNSGVIGAMRFLAHECKNNIEQYPETNIIIMPESALNCDISTLSSETMQLWNEEYIGKAVHILFGAFRWQNENYHNTFYWTHNGVIKKYFDKRHAMLLSERLSLWFNYAYLRKIYLNSGPETAIASEPRTVFAIDDNSYFIPYICSELFLNEYPDDNYVNIPIVAIVNDSLFAKHHRSQYITKILLLLARYKAIAWQREIVYVAYSQSTFIDKNGMVTLTR